MTREEIQLKCVESFKEFGNQTFVLEAGSGKTKVSLDCILTLLDCKTILVTSPSKNLKQNFLDEVTKHNFPINNYDISIETIQTACKYKDREYDLLIADEAHGIVTDVNKNLLLHNKFKHIIMLTATPEDYKEEKLALYNTYAPIRIRYLDSSKDGIINKTKVIRFMYELHDSIKVPVKVGKKIAYNGEKSQYKYLETQVKRGRVAMRNTGSEDWYNDSFKWLSSANAPSKEHQVAAVLYNRSIANRKKFLLALESSKILAKKIINLILRDVKNSKVLFFAELIDFALTITDKVYYAENPDKTTLYEAFNKGDIRVLGASKGLNVGLNMKGVNHLLFVNYVGSSTVGEQRKGRGSRLSVDDISTLIILYPMNTQYESWFQAMTKDMNIDEVIDVYNFVDLQKQLLR